MSKLTPRILLGSFLLANGCSDEATTPRSEVAPSTEAEATAPLASSGGVAHLLLPQDATALRRRISALVLACGPDADANALLARAASASLADATEPFSLWNPIAQTLSYCFPKYEPLLVEWLSSDTGKRRAAARALAALAKRQHRLAPETTVALLRHPELEETWFSFSQLRQLTSSTRTRLMEQALKALEAGTPRPYWILRALGKAEPGIAPLLLEWATDEGRERSLRDAAVVSLGELGATGQSKLLEVLSTGDREIVLSALNQLSPRTAEENAPLLQKLAKSDPAEGQPPDVAVRCAAASLLGTKSRELQACDPGQGITFKLAWLRAFESGGARKGDAAALFGELLKDPDPRVARRALLVFSSAPRRPEFDAALTRALESEDDVLVLTAARVLRDVAVSDPGATPSHDTMQSLKRALLGGDRDRNVRTQIALVDAAAALQVLSIKRALPALCDSPHVSVRNAVERALLQLRAETGCSASAPPKPHSESVTADARPATTSLALTLDGTPVSVELDTDLDLLLRAHLHRAASQGAFDGALTTLDASHTALTVVVRGSESADETPVHPSGSLNGKPFERYSVALSGQDSDPSRFVLIVALEDRPDLDATNVYLGRANADWSRLPYPGAFAEGNFDP